MTILALDLATTTGFCYGDGTENPIVGHVTMPTATDDVGPYFDFYERWLTKKIRESECTIGIFEAPMLARAKLDERGNLVQAGTSMYTVRKLIGLTVITEMVFHRAKISYYETATARAKKTSTGSGKSSKTDVLLMAKRLGIENLYGTHLSEDEADAFACWLVGVKYYAKPFWRLWESRIFPEVGQ